MSKRLSVNINLHTHSDWTVPWQTSSNKMKATYKGKEEERRHHISFKNYSFVPKNSFRLFLSIGTVAQSVERATPGQEVPGSIPAVAASSLLVGVSIM